MNRLLPFVLMQLFAVSVAIAAVEQGPKLIVSTLVIDYPISALAEGREGTVHYKLVVGKNGKAKSCIVTQSSGHADLDDAACKTMTNRVRFSPAVDKNGKRVVGTYNNQLSFRISQ